MHDVNCLIPLTYWDGRIICIFSSLNGQNVPSLYRETKPCCNFTNPEQV